jgi:hypothetical protein
MATIDLRSPDGNAFALLGYARRFAKQLGWTPTQINELVVRMTDGDYDNLVHEFKAAFPYVEVLGSRGPDRKLMLRSSGILVDYDED